jgi:ectoine hydroxylase
MTPRSDPVVWGEPTDDPLFEASVSAYERDGYVLFPDLLPERSTRRLLQQAGRCLDELRGEEVIREPQSDVVRSVFRIHESCPLFGELARDDRIRRFVRRVLGNDTYIHQSRINFKPPLGGEAFQWHSDFETWHAEDGMARMRAASCFVMLTENTVANGPLLVIPGSHRTFVRCPGETPEAHYRTSLRRQEHGVPDREAITALAHEGGLESLTGAPGTVAFFDCNLLHASSANLAPWPRTNAFFVYNASENALVQPFSGRRPRPDFLASREPHTSNPPPQPNRVAWTVRHE